MSSAPSLVGHNVRLTSSSLVRPRKVRSSNLLERILATCSRRLTCNDALCVEHFKRFEGFGAQCLVRSCSVKYTMNKTARIATGKLYDNIINTYLFLIFDFLMDRCSTLFESKSFQNPGPSPFLFSMAGNISNQNRFSTI